ncbi:hypothetical protein [Flavobacterium sp. Root186]|uniref:hypothetical protein n=1 Tax=Flavobacterium sp. Root186 TaxID=1736485 RepID=UPI000700CDA3|nr:hypothetical protein [Flavobacterium sp. Root186]KRB58118.1 hypothetical protein ASD98_07620 [Flavobacterium sp. Root186]
MIRKKRVLIRDNKGIFLKMFKRKFKNDFEFSEDSFLLKNENKSNHYDYSVFVIYEYSELVEFFKLESIKANFMVCLFSKHLYNSMSLIGEIKGLFLIDASKTKIEVLQDLKFSFKKSSSLIPKLPDKKFVISNMIEKQLEILQRALYFMM